MMDPAHPGGLPRAHGGAAGRARLRVTPEDFIVREWLGFEPDGQGDHLLLKVRKREANTQWIAKQLARIARIHVRDVGFAGLKDRHAVAEQYFSVPARTAIGQEDIQQWLAVSDEDFEVIAVARQRRKLKRGALRGNEFQIVLRDFLGDTALLVKRLESIASAGVPNYFGPQRFGRAGQNLTLAQDWSANLCVPRDRAQRSFALSAARAAIFNAVLAHRVAEGSWDRLCAGDVANLDGSASIFAVPVVDESLQQRCRLLDVHPTGPLWGAGSALPPAGLQPQESEGHGEGLLSGKSAPQGEPALPGAVQAAAAARLEQQVGALYPALTQLLAREGVQAQRRALRARVGDLSWSITAAADGAAGHDGVGSGAAGCDDSPAAGLGSGAVSSQIRLSFRLPRGAFATAVLHELLDDVIIQELPEDRD